MTGRTCNTAVGLGKLKDQQAHFDKVTTGVESRRLSDTQLENMNYCIVHEIDGIATVVARIRPSMFPALEYFEEGKAAFLFKVQAITFFW